MPRSVGDTSYPNFVLKKKNYLETCSEELDDDLGCVCCQYFDDDVRFSDMFDAGDKVVIDLDCESDKVEREIDDCVVRIGASEFKTEISK